MSSRAQAHIFGDEVEKEVAQAFAKAYGSKLGLTLSESVFYGRLSADATVKCVLFHCMPGQSGTALSAPRLIVWVRGKNRAETKPIEHQVHAFLHMQRPDLKTMNALFKAAPLTNDEQVRNESNRVSVPLAFQGWATPKSGIKYDS